MAYCSIFLYRVPKKKADAFVQALRPIMRLFEDAGCAGEELFKPANGSAKFGAMSIPEAVNLSEDEELWNEIARFKDAGHMQEVHDVVAKNPRLGQLDSRFDLLITGKQGDHAEDVDAQHK